MTERLRSDQEMAVLVVGEPDVIDSQIRLVEYDPGWPDVFETEAARIRDALGAIALRVEHVGSTSVPGLSAKPRIDIVMTVPDSDDEASYVPALVAAGFELRVREPEWHRHRTLSSKNPAVNLHVFSVGCLEVQRMLAFRDHLRVNDEDRVLYEHAKRSLAKRRWRYVQHYADAKTHVVEEILVRAGSGPIEDLSC